MALYVIPVPNPPAGTDWSYTVPGQYIEHITGITAILNATPAVTTAADSGPNNLPLAVPNAAPSLAWGQAGPFGGSPNLAVLSRQHGTFPYVGSSPANALFSTAVWSLDGWFEIAGGASTALFSPWFEDLRGTNDARWATYIVNPTGTPNTVRDFAGSGFITQTTITIPAATWHHMAFTWDGANVKTYVDGVLAVTWGNHSEAAGFADQIFVGGAPGAGDAWWGSLAAVAFYGSTLSPATIAVHAAGAGSSAGYKALVLGDSPVALWMLDDITGLGSRTVNLRITDGTHVVQEIPVGFPVTTTGTTFAYSWQPTLNSSSQAPDSSVTTVAIPDLILPAGYTVGTRTPDIGATDQWSSIFIWWSTDIMDSDPFHNPYLYPPGATLTVEQAGKQ